MENISIKFKQLKKLRKQKHLEIKNDEFNLIIILPRTMNNHTAILINHINSAFCFTDENYFSISLISDSVLLFGSVYLYNCLHGSPFKLYTVNTYDDWVPPVLDFIAVLCCGGGRIF